MGNIKNASDEFVESFAVEMLGKFARLNKLIKHSPSIGSYHEEVVKTVIQNFLSDRWTVKTGFVYKNDGEVSAQVDLMIIDENSPAAYIFKSGDFAVVTPECVVAVIEVKTKFSAENFAGAIKNIESVKVLAELPAQIRGLVLSYDSTTPTPERLGEWFKQDCLKDIRPDTAPEVIYISKRNVLLHQSTDEQFERGGKYYRSLGMPKETRTGVKGANLLKIFLAMLVAACEDRSKREQGRLAPPGTLVNLLASGQLIGSDQKFELGLGQSDDKQEA
ncbi:MAG TPA: DUF6602 domain-containing protein [Candidatus Saccharimonadales bacterium]|nr:DUF6602 domain-containing protein [Candidatus Saccharimonadales bacterium]